MPRILLNPLMNIGAGAEITLPTNIPVPAQYTETEVVSVTGANYAIYEVPANSFYKVTVAAAGGRTSEARNGGNGGKTTQIVYLYKGTKCLIWGAATGTNRKTGGRTGYPVATDQVLGGTGATGHSEGGGGGGSPTNNGRNASHNDASSGGGGAGFIAGINKPVEVQTHTESAWSRTLSSEESWSVGSFAVDHVYCYVLAGGGSGGTGSNDDARTAGGGGGAWGNGGPTSYSTAVARTTGPGGSWGVGATGARYGAGVKGAWAVLDFSRNQFSWGQGGGPGTNSNGYAILSRIDPV